MENNIDKIKTSEVITTFHKKECDDDWCCNCSEEEGINIHEKYFQINGKKEGEYISYYWNGNVFSKCTYQNGKIEGEYISYCADGRIFLKLFYQNDEIV